MRNTLAQLCTGIFFALLFQSAYAGGYDPAVHSHSEFENHVKFIRNDGQWNDAIKFQANLPGGKLYFHQGNLGYHFYDNSDLHDRWYQALGDTVNPFVLDEHYFKVNFIGSNDCPEIIPDASYQEYHNYFLGNDPSKWASRVPLFAELKYNNLYDGIDLKLYGQEMQIKYDLILKPGADPDKIKFEYEGVEQIEILDSRLIIQTSVNTITEAKPYAYQIIDGKEIEVPCHYRLEGNILSFDLPDDYDHSKELVIDPTLIFSSFTGSTADNFGYTATFDTLGNLYAGGVAFGAGYPATTGAFQTTFGGGGGGGLFGPIDMSITKFNDIGTLNLWSTFIGGSSNEQPQSMIANDDGELYIYGRTYSTNYPVSLTAYDPSHNGGADIVVTKLSADGSALIGSTYLGGTGIDGENITMGFVSSSLKYNYGDDARGEVVIDEFGNAFIASCTQSTDFPATTGALQGTNRGMQDGVIAKFNPDLSNLVWATYLGGAGNDACFSLKISSTGQIYTTGGTESGDFTITGGALQPLYNGGIDGYIARINPTGSTLISSTFLGTSAYDQCYFVELDASDNVYVVGQTKGAWPITPGVYSELNGRQFIHKLNPGLTTTIFATVFGTGGAEIDIAPTAFLVDVCEYIYVSGWGSQIAGFATGGTTNGLTVTADAYQDVTDGDDLYLIVFRRDAAAIEYATYMGGDVSHEHVDGGTSRFNKDLQVYHAVCAGCGGNDDFPTTPGVVSTTNNSFNCNLAAFKFQLDPQNITSSFSSVVISGCSPFNVNFTNTSGAADYYIWDFGDGTTDTVFSPSHTYVDPDTYLVKLVVFDSLSCNFVDSTLNTIIVHEQPFGVVSNDTFTCNGAGVTLDVSGGTSYSWSPSIGLSDTASSHPIANPPVTTTYTVIISNVGGCKDTASVTVEVNTFEAEAGFSIPVCEGTGGTQLDASALGGASPFYYEWWCDMGLTFCGLDSVFDNDPIANPTVSTMYYVQITDKSGCQSTVDSVFVEIVPHPIVDAGPDQWICPDSAPGATLLASIVNPIEAPGPYSFEWIPTTGIFSPGSLNPYARPDTTTIYTLIVTSSGNGCTSLPTTLDTLSTVTVHVKEKPLADAGPDVDLCLGESIMLHGVGSDAGPDYGYFWSPSTGLSDPLDENPIASPIKTTEYILEVYSNGCQGSDTMTLNVHTLPTVDAGNNVDLCLGDTTMLDAQADGDTTSTGLYTFRWEPAIGLSDSTIGNPYAFADSTTDYLVYATSIWGCEGSPDDLTIYLIPSPQSFAGNDTLICYGDTIQLPGGIYYTGTVPVSDPTAILYSWTPATRISDVNIPQPLVSPLATTEYTLQVDYNICTYLDTVVVHVNPDLALNLEVDTTTACEGDTVWLIATGGTGNPIWTWDPPEGLSDPTGPRPYALPGQSTEYTIGISEGHCSDSLSVQIEIIPKPTAAYLASQPQAACEDLEVNFLDVSTDAFNWIWEFGDGYLSNDQHPTHLFENPGTYQVKLTAIGPGGCRDSDSSTTITVSDNVVANFSSIPEFPTTLSAPETNIQFTDLSIHADNLVWDFGDGMSSTGSNPSHTYSSSGTYHVTLFAINDEGCMDTITLGPLIVKDPELFIPNIFTPDGDGVNELFEIKYSGNQSYLLEIFDRWGALLYSSRDKEKWWNGNRESGSEMAEGVYFYSLVIGGKVYSGNVTLMR